MAGSDQGNEGRKPHRPVRENLESLAVAVALALVLKFFAIEAFEIPTSSMQPALMGDSAKGIYDRILVDKLSFLLREPRRWEVAVFKYPLHQAQNYIKRIWGLPGEWLLIQGGDVWLGEEGDFLAATRPRTILRKPPELQENLWLEVYDSAGLPGSLPRVLQAPPGAALTAEGSGAVLAGSAGETLARWFLAVTDADAHGYRPDAAEAIHASLTGHAAPARGPKLVGDLRLAARVELLAGGGAVVAEIEEATRLGRSVLRAEIPPAGSPGGARLLRNGRLLGEAAGIGLPAGRAARLELWNWDDRLRLLLDGREILSHEYGGDGEELSGCRVSLGLAAPGRLRLDRLRLWRDIYYTEPEQAGRETGPWLRLGPRHFLMLGDNTRHSADGRAWEALFLKDPATGRVIRGNDRLLREPGDPLNPDWNPVLVPPARVLVFTDDQGEEHVLRPELPGAGQAWVREAEAWLSPGHNEAHRKEWICGVPREFMVGKGLAIFWPLNPFSRGRAAWRLGFIH